jgi:glycosyltransferase involved in cell wall biosynthesis
MNAISLQNNKPLISIVIPVFNRSELVMQAVESALSQSYPNREVVIVDDGSTDGTYKNLKKLKADIRLYRQPHKGQSAARNLGWRSCKGDYVLFLDSDDVLEKDAIQNLWPNLFRAERISPTWGVSYGKMLTCDSNLTPVKVKPKKYYDGTILPNLFFDNFVRMGTYLVKKSILQQIGGFKEDLYLNEDRLMLFSIAIRYKFVFVDKIVVRYRRHSANRARNDTKMKFHQGTKHLDYFFRETRGINHSTQRIKNRVYAKEHVQLAKVAWRNDLYKIFLYHWRQAYSYRKIFMLNPKYLLRALFSVWR